MHVLAITSLLCEINGVNHSLCMMLIRISINSLCENPLNCFPLLFARKFSQPIYFYELFARNANIRVNLILYVTYAKINSFYQCYFAYLCFLNNCSPRDLLAMHKLMVTDIELQEYQPSSTNGMAFLSHFLTYH